MDYGYTIQKLKIAELIKENDMIIACADAPSQWAFFWGGAIGGALSAAKCKQYLMSVNTEEIRLFDLDKKTGDYLNTYSFISRSDIIKANVAGAFNAKTINIKTVKSGNLRFSTANNFKGFQQKETITTVKEFLKTIKK